MCLKTFDRTGNSSQTPGTSGCAVVSRQEYSPGKVSFPPPHHCDLDDFDQYQLCLSYLDSPCVPPLC